MVAGWGESVSEPDIGHPWFPVASTCHRRDSGVVTGCRESLRVYLSVSAKRKPPGGGGGGGR